MPGPYPLPTLAPSITAAGISIVALEDMLASLQAQVRSIYGADVNLAADTQDGQFLGIFAQAYYDASDAAVTVYNGFSPSYAQGTNLANLVKINGLRKKAASNSQVALQLIGQAGTTIAAGILTDDNNNQWALPANTVIPSPSGSVIVTATCQVPGAIALASGSTTIGASGGLNFLTVILGWQSATAVADASPGLAVESDATLRTRQSVSTALPAQTPLQSILAAVAQLAGIGRYAIYENDISSTDANGVPDHSIAVVVEGGDAQTIAQTIELMKNPGTGTYGTTQEVVLDPSGVPDTINFFYLTGIPIYASVTIRRLTGYVSTTGGLIQAAVTEFISTLPIGQLVGWNRLSGPANLSGTAAIAASGFTGAGAQAQLDALSSTYEITSIFIGLTAAPTSGQVDIPILFNQAAECAAGNVTIIPT